MPLLNKGLVLGILAILAIISIASYHFYYAEQRKNIRKISQNIESRVKNNIKSKSQNGEYDEIELISPTQNENSENDYKNTDYYADDSRSREDFELID